MNEVSAKEAFIHNDYEIAIDFDGVLHLYSSGWTGHDNVADGPVSDMSIPWLVALAKEFGPNKVCIHTCRLSVPQQAPEAAEAIRAWLVTHGMDRELADEIHYWDKPGKPNARLYIDDRAFHFDGTYPTPDEIRAHKAYYKRSS